MLRDLFKSKKFVSLLVGVLVFVLGRFGLGVSEDQLLPIVGLIASYIIGQGVSDSGKEAAKELAKNPLGGSGS